MGFMGWFCQIWRSFWGSLGRVAQNGKSHGWRVEVIIPKDIQLARRIKSERLVILVVLDPIIEASLFKIFFL